MEEEEEKEEEEGESSPIQHDVTIVSLANKAAYKELEGHLWRGLAVLPAKVATPVQNYLQPSVFSLRLTAIFLVISGRVKRDGIKSNYIFLKNRSSLRRESMLVARSTCTPALTLMRLYGGIYESLTVPDIGLSEQYWHVRMNGQRKSGRGGPKTSSTIVSFFIS